MNKKILTTLTALLLLGGNIAFADMPNDNKAKQEVKQQAGMQEALKLLDSMNAGDAYNETLMQTLDKQSSMLPPQIKNNKEKLEKYNKIMKEFMMKYMGWDKVKNDMAKVYAKYYTPQELKELAKFYATPVGKKSVKVLPKIATESMMLSQSKMMPHMGELQKSMAELMKSK